MTGDMIQREVACVPMPMRDFNIPKNIKTVFHRPESSTIGTYCPGIMVYPWCQDRRIPARISSNSLTPIHLHLAEAWGRTQMPNNRA